MLEVGCGTGNTFFTLMKENLPNLFFYGCDIS